MVKHGMILHLMPDDKFIDYFIEQSEEIAPGQSTYWIVTQKETKTLRYVKSKIVKNIFWDRKRAKDMAKNCRTYEKVICHSFFMPHLKVFLQEIRKDVVTGWMFWGADGYAYTANAKKWYLPLTWEWKEKTKIGSKNFIQVFFLEAIFRINAYRKSKLTRKMIKMIDVCGTWVNQDFEMLKPINPAMAHVHYSYFSYKQLNLEQLTIESPVRRRLWLGNSASDTNNHLDALTYLKKIDWNGEIVVPLSYGGSPTYKNTVVELGKFFFGEKFIPLIDFIPLDQYHQYINSCEIVWMNHIRQQAGGNILSALYMGKAVIMNEYNNLYKTLRDWGIRFMPAQMLSNIDAFDWTGFLENRDIIKDNLSLSKSYEGIKAMYNFSIRKG